MYNIILQQDKAQTEYPKHVFYIIQNLIITIKKILKKYNRKQQINKIIVMLDKNNYNFSFY